MISLLKEGKIKLADVSRKIRRYPSGEMEKGHSKLLTIECRTLVLIWTLKFY